MIMKKHLERRTFLRGAGAAVALPFLDAMTPAFAAPARTDAKTPCRMAFSYVPNGIIMPGWTPRTEGTGFELTPIMKPLGALREDVLVLTGLSHINGRALGDGPGDHARAGATFLTGVHPKKTDGADIRAGVSVDQIAANAIGSRTKFASIELGCETAGMVGNCDSGYSCAYSNSISWKTPVMPMPPETNPRAVFERLFGDGEIPLDPAARARLARQNKSILDFVREDTERLSATLGKSDKRKMDEYLFSIREIERRIEAAEARNRESGREVAPSIARPSGIPVEFEDHAKLMYDLQVVAFQTDMTRVTSFMLAREGSNRTYRSIGVPEAHHGLTHHLNNQEKIDKIAKINTLHVELFAYFLSKLKATPDGDGTLLDHSMVVYGSGIADGNAHTHHDLPVLLAGGGVGGVRTGRHVRYASETPMANLYLSMLELMGVHTDQMGDSNGRADHLSV